MKDETVRLRMAPAPSGFLHLGNVRTFLFDYLYARHEDGRLVLRIEDTDASRSSAEAEQAIFESLHWLGIDWDEGPNVGGGYGPYRQTEREDLHRVAARELLRSGHAYECFCTEEDLERERKEQQARSEAPRYGGRCRSLTDSEKQAFRRQGREPAIRFLVPEDEELAWDDLVYGHISFDSSDIGDFVILRANGTPIYNLANVVDDHGMAISVSLRSQSHLSNTPRQILLYRALSWPMPSFAHVPDVNDLRGRKLSKRYGAKSVLEYRNEGYLPEAVVNYLALLGWSPPNDQEFLSMQDLKDLFGFARVQRSNAAFDPERLEWFNAQYMKRLSPPILARRMLRFLEDAGVPLPKDREEAASQVEGIVPLISERVRTLVEIPPMVDFFFRDPSALTTESFKIRQYSPAKISFSLGEAMSDLQALEPWNSDAIVSSVTASAEKIDWKRGDLFMAIRIAITGRTVTPPLTESMEILGRETSVRRLRRAATLLEQAELS